MSNEQCTHTRDWWKNMVPCWSCGEPYSDEEAERIAAKSSREYRQFTAEQERIIAAHQRRLDSYAEDEVEDEAEMREGVTSVHGQTFYEALANELHPEGCQCNERHSGGDCEWCRVYYGWDLEEESK